MKMWNDLISRKLPNTMKSNSPSLRCYHCPTPLPILVDIGMSTMVLNNPPVNAIDSAFIEQTIEALDRLEGDEDIQGVIITSVSGTSLFTTLPAL